MKVMRSIEIPLTSEQLWLANRSREWRLQSLAFASASGKNLMAGLENHIGEPDSDYQRYLLATEITVIALKMKEFGEDNQERDIFAGYIEHGWKDETLDWLGNRYPKIAPGYSYLFGMTVLLAGCHATKPAELPPTSQALEDFRVAHSPKLQAIYELQRSIFGGEPLPGDKTARDNLDTFFESNRRGAGKHWPNGSSLDKDDKPPKDYFPKAFYDLDAGRLWQSETYDMAYGFQWDALFKLLGKPALEEIEKGFKSGGIGRYIGSAIVRNVAKEAEKERKHGAIGYPLENIPEDELPSLDSAPVDIESENQILWDKIEKLKMPPKKKLYFKEWIFLRDTKLVAEKFGIGQKEVEKAIRAGCKAVGITMGGIREALRESSKPQRNFGTNPQK